MKLTALVVFLSLLSLTHSAHAEGIRIKSIALSDSELSADVESIDTVQNSDCDPNTAGNQEEPFGGTKFRLAVQNNYLENVSIEKYQFRVAGLYRSRRYSPISLGDIEPSKINESIEGYFALAVGSAKRFVGANSDVPSTSVVRRITIIIYARSSSGRRYSTRARISRAFGDEDNC